MRPIFNKRNSHEMLELSINNFKITITKMFKVLMEKASYIKVTMRNMLTDLEQKAEDKHKHMGCVIRGRDILK